MRSDRRGMQHWQIAWSTLLLVSCRHSHGDASAAARKDRPQLWSSMCRPDRAARRNRRGSSDSDPEPLVEDGDAVFFVGNSFMAWQNRSLPEWIQALGRALSPPIRIEVGSDIVLGNTPLAEFLHHPATQAALASRKYRVFVLQGEEFEPVDHRSEFHQAVRDFNRAILAAGGRTVLFMTWEFTWRRFLDDLAASYDEIGKELDIPVIPIGLAYDDCGRTPPPGQPHDWLTVDPEHPQGDLHENQMGHALNTYATFQLLTGRNPHGQNFVAAGNDNSDALMRFFSDTAWARVEPRLRAGCE